MPCTTALSEQSLLSGSVLYHPDGDISAWLANARLRGMRVYDIDCDRAKTMSAILKIIAHAMDFDDQFEGKLDRLYDHVTEIVLDTNEDIVMVLRNLHEADASGRGDQIAAIVQVLEEAVEYARSHGHVLTVLVEPSQQTRQ
jgi:RNAse (barnase) inhibitor barstar